MKIDLYTYTNKGSREINEDSFRIKTDGGGRCIAVLCDGLGGHDCGEVASAFAAEKTIEALGKMDSLEQEKILGVLGSVNDGLIELQSQKESYNGMRTTAVGCIVGDETVHSFNCGDSRFYYFSNGKLSTMSKDHSIPQMSVDLGEMTFDDIRGDADRNKLLKVMGQPTEGGAGTVYEPIKHKKGDAFLLCSDGFWEYVIEEEMEIDLSKSTTCKEWIEYMLVRLLLRRNPDNDNFTVVSGIIG